MVRGGQQRIKVLKNDYFGSSVCFSILEFDTTNRMVEILKGFQAKTELEKFFRQAN